MTHSVTLAKKVSVAILTLLLVNLLPLQALAATLPITSVVKIGAGYFQSGSGFVMGDEKPYIITNAHVVLDEDTYKPWENYRICTVGDANAEVTCNYVAQLLYADADKDIALLEITAVTEEAETNYFNYPPIDIQNIESPEIGSQITILGFPALGGNTVTASTGIASGFTSFELDTGEQLTAIKTDSNVISGTSGGLALDENGGFVGIPSAVLSNESTEKIGIIISAEEVKEWVNMALEEVQEQDFQAPKIVKELPAQIETLTVKKLSNTSVELSWEKPIGEAYIDHYDIIYDTQPLFGEEPEPNLTSTHSGSTKFTINNLSSSKTYYFAIGAEKAKVWSPQTTINMGSGKQGDAVFSDVSAEDENGQAIKFLKRTGTIEGYEDGTFKPNKTIQRAELMKIIVEAQTSDLDPSVYNECFSDVHDEWFARYICYAKEKGWVGGYPDGTFKPGQDINLAESLKIILRAYDMPFGKVKTDESFPENLKNQWYSQYIALAVEFGMLADSPETINMDEKISRGKFSEIAYRTIWLHDYKDTYSPQVWKNTEGETINPAAYFALTDDLLEKTLVYENTINGEITEDETTITKNCPKSKKENCYTRYISSNDALYEYAIVGDVIQSLNAEWKKESAFSYVLSEPETSFANHNIVKHWKYKEPLIREEDDGYIALFDGITSLEFLGNEKVKTAAGEYDAIKVKMTNVQVGEAELEGVNVPAYMITEGTVYFVEGIGDVKYTGTTTLYSVGGSIPLIELEGELKSIK